MIPQPDGTYLAKTEILPLVLIGANKAPSPRSGEPGGGLVYISGCAGPRHPLDHEVSRGIEVVVPGSARAPSSGA
jgi:hypothetical protein